MTKQEVNNLLALLKANYSYAFKTMSTQEKYLMLNSWTFALQDMDAQVVFLAVMKLLTVSKWIPTVAEIREKAQSMYYEAAYDLLPDAIESQFMTEDEKQRRIAMSETITAKTSFLRGDGVPELRLKTIADNPGYAQLMGISRDTMGLQGNTFRIEEGHEEDEDT